VEVNPDTLGRELELELELVLLEPFEPLEFELSELESLELESFEFESELLSSGRPSSPESSLLSPLLGVLVGRGLVEVGVGVGVGLGIVEVEVMV